MTDEINITAEVGGPQRFRVLPGRPDPFSDEPDPSTTEVWLEMDPDLGFLYLASRRGLALLSLTDGVLALDPAEARVGRLAAVLGLPQHRTPAPAKSEDR